MFNHQIIADKNKTNHLIEYYVFYKSTQKYIGDHFNVNRNIIIKDLKHNNYLYSSLGNFY